MVQPVGKQAYKSELPKKWRIDNVFHVSLLEQNITKKRQADKEIEIELEAGNNIKYELEAIWDSMVYAQKLTAGHLPDLYYLIS